ncbi:MAG: hypothetical protein QOH90_1550, partial [Actinomycetota bacterium]|nr:hypothetical protein [Actinomycetota bacterium]
MKSVSRIRRKNDPARSVDRDVDLPQRENRRSLHYSSIFRRIELGSVTR